MDRVKIILSTNNKNKVNEIKSILGDKFEYLTLSDINYHNDIEEYGQTLSQNALIKVEEIRRLCPNEIILADDSGICIEKLNGFPSIKSKRFLDGSDSDRNNYLINKLKQYSLEERKADMIAYIALSFPNGDYKLCEGKIVGYITDKEIGDNGFAYDRIFYMKEYNKTLAEMTSEEKNSVSFRKIALEKTKKKIINYLYNAEGIDPHIYEKTLIINASGNKNGNTMKLIEKDM